MKMKRVLGAIAAGAMLLSAGCSSGTAENSESGKISVVTTIFPQYDFARQIGGDKIELTMLVTPGGESHAYEPTPQDMVAVRNCDVFICVGGESDVWANDILNAVDTREIQIVNMMECVETVEEELKEGMEGHGHSESGGHNHEEAEYDEHVWTSPENAMKISRAIGEALIAADGDNSEYYTKNLESYLAELEVLDSDFRQAVAEAERTTLVFGDRFPFRYFAGSYGLDYYAAFPGCSTETDVSASVMSFLINKVRDENIPVVYYIEFSAQKIADTICDETGSEALLFHSCHTVSKEEFEGGATYISLMRQNLENLKRGLN